MMYKLIPIPAPCSLMGYKINCYGEIQNHHVINKSKTRGNAEGRAILAACPPEIMAEMCAGHNVSRMADTREAVKILLLQKIYRYGWFHMKDWFNDFLATYDVWPFDVSPFKKYKFITIFSLN